MLDACVELLQESWERGMTAHLSQPWEGPACPPFKASEAALAGNPRWPPLTKRMRVAGSEAVALAQHAHQSKVQTLCHSAVEGLGRTGHHTVMPRRETNGLKRKNRS
jgi:hypothetical protein